MANEFKIRKGLIVTGASGGTVVDIQGSQGQLFSVTDDLSGDIFAVSDISGVPIFTVNSSSLSTFDGLVSGITPVNAANFVTKAYVDGGGGAGSGFLPLSAGSGFPLTGDLYINKSAPALRLNDSGDNVPYELRVDGTTFSIKEVTNSRTLMSMTAGAVITLDSLASNTVINTTSAMVVPNGSIGIGVTSVSDWGWIIDNALQFANGAFVAGRTDATAAINLGANAFVTATGGNAWKYFNGGAAATRYVQQVGQHYFQTAGVGAAAGDAITWSTALNILNNGNSIFTNSVSIGTTVSPTRTLDVRGTGLNIFGSGGNTELMLRGQVEGTGTVRDLGSWHLSVRSDVGGDNDDLKLLRFITGTFSGTAMQISNSTGNIGIGTNTTPSADYKLILVNTNEDLLRLHNSTDGLDALISFTNPGGTLGRIQGIDNGGLGFDTGNNSGGINTNAMFIDNSGNVGIGVTGPTSKLQVNYSAAPSFNANGGANALTLIRDDSGGDLNEVGAGLVFAQRYINTATANIGVGGIYGVKTIASGSFGGGLAFYTQPFGSGNMDRRMIINHAGAIKFNAYDSTNNTGTPTYLLGTDASGNVVKTLSSAAPGSLWAASGNDIYNTNSADVGIGITNPDSKLTVSSGTSNNVANFKSSDGTAYIAISDNSSSSALGNQVGVVGDQMYFATGDVERMRLVPDGNSTFLILKAKPSTYNSKSFLTLYGTNSSTYGGSVIARSSISSETDGSAYGANLKFYTNDSSNVEQTRITVLSTGNVGIGVTGPSTKLEVSSSLTSGIKVTNSGTINGEAGIEAYHTGAQAGTAYAGYITKTGAGGTNVGIYTAASGATNNYGLIVGSGNVGIGTISPEDKLEVSGGALKIKASANHVEESYIKFGRIDQADGNYENHIKSVTGSGASQCKVTFLVCDTSATGRTNLLTLDGGNTRSLFVGYVGIGMTAPNNLLNLSKDVADGDVAIYIQNFNSVVGSTNETTSLKFAHGNDGVVGYEAATVVGGKEGDFESNIANVKGFLSFSTASGTSLTNSVNIIERMRITGAGNVGIGTSTPLAKLDIQGTQGQLFSVTDDLSGSIFAVADISGVPIFDVNSSGVSYFDGSLGVGTDSPKSKLHVLDGAAGTYTPYGESDTLVVESATPGGISLIGTGAGGNSKQSIVFGTPSDVTSASIIYNSNNSVLSIGTTTVSNFVKFVSGNGALALTLDASQNAIFTGNVGIGITGPTKKLDVIDTINGAYGTSTQQTVARFFNKANDATINSAFINLQCSSDNEASNPVAAIGVVSEGTSSNNGSFVAATRSSGGIIERLRINSAGAIKFNAYGAGTLVTDASGNITVSSGGGAGGPFLPLAGNTIADAMTGDINIGDNLGINWYSATNAYADITLGTDFRIFCGKSAADLVIQNASNDVKIIASTDFSMQAGGNILIDDYIVHNNDLDTKFGFTAANQFQVIAGGNTNLNVQGNGVDLSYAGSTRLNTQTGGVAITGELITTGDVGIGITNPDVPLDVTGSDVGSAFNDGIARFQNTTSVSTGNATVINIRNSYLGANSTLIKFFRTSTSSSIANISFNTAGDAVNYNTGSDYRLKEDLKTFNGLNIIDNISVYNYQWKKSKSRGHGVLAHELASVFPDAVTGEKDAEEMQSVDYSKLVPVLIKSVQELKKEIELLKQQLNK